MSIWNSQVYILIRFIQVRIQIYHSMINSIVKFPFKFTINSNKQDYFLPILFSCSWVSHSSNSHKSNEKLILWKTPFDFNNCYCFNSLYFNLHKYLNYNNFSVQAISKRNSKIKISKQVKFIFIHFWEHKISNFLYSHLVFPLNSSAHFFSNSFKLF